MARYKMIVLTKPVAGRETEFNEWYSGRHLSDILSIPGFTTAQRFRIKGQALSRQSWDYLAIYEIEHDDPQAAIDDMISRVDTPAMRMSDSMDGDFYCVLYEEITPCQVAQK